MKSSKKLIDHLRQAEGLSLKAYADVAGRWTIGYGHTAGVHPSDRISTYQADAYLLEDLRDVEQAIEQLNVAVTQGQFDALVDFAFNLGIGALQRSTLLSYIRQKRPVADIQAQFRRWVYAGGCVMPGLVKRREWEARRWAE